MPARSRFSPRPSGGARARWGKPALMAGSCLCALALGAGLFFLTDCPPAQQALASGVGEVEEGPARPASDAPTVIAALPVSAPPEPLVEEEEPFLPGWSLEEGGRRYRLPDGSFAVGFTEVDGAYYFFDGEGFAQTGLVETADGVRYFASDGSMRTGVVTVGNVTYSFGEDGVMEQKAKLAVPVIMQNPELPNGCEVTSLAEVLQYLGFPVTHTGLAAYLPCEPIAYRDGVSYTADPEEAYVGDPSTTAGWYCFEGPVIQAADAYLAEQGSPLRAEKVSGADAEALLSCLQQGRPVIVWITQQLQNVRHTGFTWILPDGESVHPYGGLHCVVLSGMDLEAGTVTFADPIYGEWEAELGRFIEIYEGMGSRAVVIG